MSSDVDVSIIMATYQRRDEVLGTLNRLMSLRLDGMRTEIIVVDNASPDGTAEAVASRFPLVMLVRLDENLGSCAKAAGVERARGRLLLFLDDDSFPRSGSLERMVRAFDADDRLGAAGFVVHLADGRRECSALPNAFVGCGVGLRREALDAVGGLDTGFFMQAEEYDLSFRLANAGWRVETFADLHVDHRKSPQARLNGRTMFYDTRNNLVVAARYLPEAVAGTLRDDWRQRYRWLAEGLGLVPECERGAAAGLAVWDDARREYRGQRLSAEAFETLFRFGEIERRMAELAAAGVRRVILAELGKNIYPFVAACRQVGLEMLCIADDRLGGAERVYRGIPVVDGPAAQFERPDAVVVSNCAPFHAQLAANRWEKLGVAPVHCWFGADRVRRTAEPERTLLSVGS